MPMYDDCDYETKCKILHKLIHEGRIAEYEIDQILSDIVLFNQDMSKVYVANHRKSPSAIKLYDRDGEVDLPV